MIGPSVSEMGGPLVHWWDSSAAPASGVDQDPVAGHLHARFSGILSDAVDKVQMFWGCTLAANAANPRSAAVRWTTIDIVVGWAAASAAVYVGRIRRGACL
nr:hypothetical protein GCM10017611_04550 [Rhodococcus wratislaviensis]